MERVRRHSGLLKWGVAAAAFAIMVPSFALAGGGGADPVRITNEPQVRVQDTAGGNINSDNYGQLGKFGTRPVPGVLSNKELPAGIIDVGDCNNTETPFGAAQASDITVPSDGGRTVITNILITGRPPFPGEGGDTPPSGEVLVSSDAIQNPPGNPVNLLEARVDAATPNVSIEQNLALTAPMHFKGRAIGGGDNGDCAFAIIGYIRTSAL